MSGAKKEPDGESACRASRADLGRPLRTEELPSSIRCPFCGSDDSEQFSTFGSSLSLSQFYCNACRTVFEAFKWKERGSGPDAEVEPAPDAGVEPDPDATVEPDPDPAVAPDPNHTER